MVLVKICPTCKTKYKPNEEICTKDGCGVPISGVTPVDDSQSEILEITSPIQPSGLDEKEKKLLIENKNARQREEVAANVKTIREAEATLLESPVEAQSDNRTITETSPDQEQDHGLVSLITSFHDFPLIKEFPAPGNEADIYLINYKDKKAILKLYRLGREPKEDMLKRVQDLSIEFPEHIIKIFEFGYDEKFKRWFEIQEYAEHGTFKDYSAKYDAKKNLRRIINELASSLKILNDHNLLHLDLKPSNILIRLVQPLDLILTDFGFASFLDNDFSKKMTNVKGTPLYQSPEAFTGVVGKESDYWSLGIMILEILTGKHPFSGINSNVINFTLSTKGVAIPEEIPAEYVLLLKGLLTRDPKKRWGYEQITRWKNGEKDIPLFYFYTEYKEGEYKKAYKFAGKEHYSLEELVTSFNESPESWKDAISHVQRGYITKWLENNEDYDNSVKIEKIRDESRMDDNLSLLRIIYSFNKELPFILLGKAITLHNLFLYLGKLLKKESTVEETFIAESVINNTLFNYCKEYIRISGKGDEIFYNPNSNDNPDKTRMFRTYSNNDFTILLELLLKSVLSQEQNQKLMTAYNFLNILINSYDFIIPMDVHKDAQTEVEFILANRELIIKKEVISAFERDYVLPKNLFAGIYNGGPTLYVDMIKLLNRKQAQKLLLSKEDYKSIQNNYVLPLGLIKSIDSDGPSMCFEGIELLKNKQKDNYLLTKENLRLLQEQYIVPAELTRSIQSDDESEYFYGVQKLRNIQLLSNDDYKKLVSIYLLPKDLTDGLESDNVVEFEQAIIKLKAIDGKKIALVEYKKYVDQYWWPSELTADLKCNQYSRYVAALHKYKDLESRHLLITKKEYQERRGKYSIPKDIHQGIIGNKLDEYEKAVQKLRKLLEQNTLDTKFQHYVKLIGLPIAAVGTVVALIWSFHALSVQNRNNQQAQSITNTPINKPAVVQNQANRAPKVAAGSTHKNIESPSTNISGSWKGVYSGKADDLHVGWKFDTTSYSMHISQKGTNIVGSTVEVSHNQRITGKIEGTMVNKRVQFRRIVQGIVSNYEGEVSDDGMSANGTWNNAYGAGQWSMEKTNATSVTRSSPPVQAYPSYDYRRYGADKTMVTINSQPSGALVFIDKKQTGRTPLKISLASGSHGIKVQKSGFKPLWDIIDTRQNGQKEFNFALSRE